MSAAFNNNPKVLKVLLDHGADTAPDAGTGDAFRLARGNGDDCECARLLRAHATKYTGPPADLSAFFSSLNLTSQQVKTVTAAGITRLEDLDGVTKEDLVGGGVLPIVANKIARAANP